MIIRPIPTTPRYLLYLPTDPDEWIAMIEQLAADEWIDPQTRAVFLEFIVYSQNTNRFIVIQVNILHTQCKNVV